MSHSERHARFLCDTREIRLEMPPGTIVYEPAYPREARAPGDVVREAIGGPLGSPPLAQLLARRPDGDVVIVVSDITRPIPYAEFLPQLLELLAGAGVRSEEVLILIATGMHRPSTAAERLAMFGPEVVATCRIEDHVAEDEVGLVEIPGRSASGRTVHLNRRYVQAGFRIVTGLVEPHFMAGFSGGRKAVCPGLASLDTVRNFHGERFLANPNARNAHLDGNPLHEEALSVARLCPPQFTLNVVLDGARRLIRAFAGDLEPAHEAACAFVKACACRPVQREADVVVTSSGGYPLDATFYQCVKGMVSSLPAVRPGGVVLSVGGCREGVGSPEYAAAMDQFAGRWRDFLEHIRQPGTFTKDQWQFQMQARALARVGEGNLHFVTPNLPEPVLRRLSITPHAVTEAELEGCLADLLRSLAPRGGVVAVLPEGPYCVPV